MTRILATLKKAGIAEDDDADFSEFSVCRAYNSDTAATLSAIG